MPIPYISPTGDHSPNREHYATCILVNVLNMSNAPPLGQQTACKSPHPAVLGVVRRDNDRRII